MLSVLHKIASYYSFASWLLCSKLVRFLHPTDDQIREMVKLSSSGDGKNNSNIHATKESRSASRHRKKNEHHMRNGTPGNETFKIPRNTPFVLEAMRVRAVDLHELQFYPEYQWLVDFSLCALMVFILSETYAFFFPSRVDDLNLSLVWCLLVVAFTLKMLFSLSRLYFQGDEAISERSLCLTAGCLFFLGAMIVLIADDKFLELGLNEAYMSFNQSAHAFLEKRVVFSFANPSSTGPLSKLIFKFWLAICCGLVGALFMFPGLRFAQMHKDCLKLNSDSKLMKLILNFSFIAPLFIILLWIRPVSRAYLTERVFRGSTIMTPKTFESCRILFIFFFIAVRFSLIHKYLQAYLNLAPTRLTKLRKEAGKITNHELKKLIAGVFYYLCIVCLQYLGPLLLLLYNTFLYKVLANHSWSGTMITGSDDTVSPSSSPIPSHSSSLASDESSLKSVFTPVLFHGLLGFTSWWISSVYFVTSVVGFVYHSYFS